MAWTTTDLQAIETAIASGELSVNFEGRSVTYRSIAELLKSRAEIKAELEQSGVIAGTVRVSYAAVSKG